MSLYKTWPLWKHPETNTLAARPETLVSKVRNVASPLQAAQPKVLSMPDEGPGAKETLKASVPSHIYSPLWVLISF